MFLATGSTIRPMFWLVDSCINIIHYYIIIIQLFELRNLIFTAYLVCSVVYDSAGHLIHQLSLHSRAEMIYSNFKVI